VIKGWDKGVATMKKGEKALLTIARVRVTVTKRVPPTIPPAATLAV